MKASSSKTSEAPTMHETKNDLPKTARTELGDADTADLFTEISRGMDKLFWFVEAHSQASK
jgi:starvation-inducible DNA-binding protein